MSLNDLLDLLDKCILEMDLLSACYWIVGVTDQKATAHSALWNALLEKRRFYAEAATMVGAPGLKVDDDQVRASIESLEVVQVQIRDSLMEMKIKALGVRCTDEQLRQLALQIRQEGILVVSKTDLEELFDLEHSIPGWKLLPSYTDIVLGWRFGILSPEAQLFTAMCRAHDAAARAKDKLACGMDGRANAEFDRAEFTGLLEAKTDYKLQCQQTVLNASFVLEAFINGLATIYVSDTSNSLSRKERLYLQELDPAGGGKRKNVRTDDKLTEWVRLMSPRRETFDKGGRLFQRYRDVIVANRDAIVHLSHAKLAQYRGIDFAVAHEAAKVTLEMIEEVCRFIQPADSPAPLVPPWFRQFRQNGLFS